MYYIANYMYFFSEQRSAMEGKRDDESMRQFNRRVREGTARLLRDEFKEHSSTNKRKKK